jgi:hypothetical protein
LKAKSLEPMPRIVAPSTALEPENGVEASSVTLGVMPESAETLPTARSCSVSALNALIAIGTSCTSSARFCAVTTISWMPPLLSASWSCATAGMARAHASAASETCVTLINVTPMSTSLCLRRTQRLA